MWIYKVKERERERLLSISQKLLKGSIEHLARCRRKRASENENEKVVRRARLTTRIGESTLRPEGAAELAAEADSARGLSVDLMDLLRRRSCISLSHSASVSFTLLCLPATLERLPARVETCEQEGER